jgi:hypothetical protein
MVKADLAALKEWITEDSEVTETNASPTETTHWKFESCVAWHRVDLKIITVV